MIAQKLCGVTPCDPGRGLGGLEAEASNPDLRLSLRGERSDTV